jgi:predicted dithiol-disulfide oxidoreductase (DUF899 family)
MLNHLENEKAFDRQRDRLSAECREMPWTLIDRNYQFTGNDGKQITQGRPSGSTGRAFGRPLN